MARRTPAGPRSAGTCVTLVRHGIDEIRVATPPRGAFLTGGARPSPVLRPSIVVRLDGGGALVRPGRPVAAVSGFPGGRRSQDPGRRHGHRPGGHRAVQTIGDHRDRHRPERADAARRPPAGGRGRPGWPGPADPGGWAGSSVRRRRVRGGDVHLPSPLRGRSGGHHSGARSRPPSRRGHGQPGVPRTGEHGGPGPVDHLHQGSPAAGGPGGVESVVRGRAVSRSEHLGVLPAAPASKPARTLAAGRHPRCPGSDHELGRRRGDLGPKGDPMNAADPDEPFVAERLEPSPDRPAFYALFPGGWRDYWTLLHPPYTLWHLSYVALGAAVAPRVDGPRLGASLLGFFLGVGITAHALDELNGRPLGTRIASPVLWAMALGALAGAVALGVLGALAVSLWLLAFVGFGSFIVLAYNLEL